MVFQKKNQDVTIPTDINKVTIATKFNEKLGMVLDDTKLNGTLTLKNADGFVIGYNKSFRRKSIAYSRTCRR